MGIEPDFRRIAEGRDAAYIRGPGFDLVIGARSAFVGIDERLENEITDRHRLQSLLNESFDGGGERSDLGDVLDGLGEGLWVQFLRRDRAFTNTISDEGIFERIRAFHIEHGPTLAGRDGAMVALAEGAVTDYDTPYHADMSYGERTQVALTRSLSQIDTATQQAAGELLTPANIAIMAVSLGVIAAAAATGIGLGAIVIVGWVSLGWTIFQIVGQLTRIAMMIGQAQSDGDLDEVASAIAQFLGAFLAEKLFELLTRGAGRMRTQGAGEPNVVRMVDDDGAPGGGQQRQNDQSTSTRPTRTHQFQESGTDTHLRRSVEVDGQTIQINSGHAYNRVHHTGDVRDSGLSMDAIDNAIVNDIADNVNMGNLPNVPQSTSNNININGYSLTYDVARLPNGNVSVSTYYPGP